MVMNFYEYIATTSKLQMRIQEVSQFLEIVLVHLWSFLKHFASFEH
jgi:hypothetical protein